MYSLNVHVVGKYSFALLWLWKYYYFGILIPVFDVQCYRNCFNVSEDGADMKPLLSRAQYCPGLAVPWKIVS